MSGQNGLRACAGPLPDGHGSVSGLVAAVANKRRDVDPEVDARRPEARGSEFWVEPATHNGMCKGTEA